MQNKTLQFFFSGNDKNFLAALMRLNANTVLYFFQSSQD